MQGNFLTESLINRPITGHFMQWKKALRHCWQQQIENAKYLIDKVEKYLEDEAIKEPKEQT